LWRAEEVDQTSVGRHPTAQTGLYLVTHTAHGHQFSYYRKGSAASLLAPADIPEAGISGAKFLHVSGISQAISESAREAVAHAIDIARKAGVQVSYDTNLRTRLWSVADAKRTIEATAAVSDLTKTSLEDAEALTGLAEPQSIAEHFLKLGAATVVITLGAQGVHVATAREQHRVPGYQVAAVDATGAGDAFTGALLSEFARGRDLMAAARFANAAAALSTLGYGAVDPLPRRKDVAAFLAAQ